MKALLSFLILFGLPCISIGKPAGDSLLIVLKAEIRQKKSYDRIKEKRIDRLKQDLLQISRSDFSSQYLICDQIYEEYRDFKFDSAFVYAQKLLRIGYLSNDLTKQYESKIKLGTIQLSGGMFKEAFDCIRQVDISRANDSVRVKYYSLKSRALRDLADYNKRSFSAPSNRILSLSTLDSAISLAKIGSYEYLKKMAEKFALTDQPEQAADILRKVLINPGYTAHQQAMAANDLSHLTNGKERNDLITLAAIYDIRSSTKLTLATFTLGKVLFKAGEIDNAILLLEEALSQAGIYGNEPQKREITAILTQASAQRLINLENQKNSTLSILIIIVLFILVGLTLVSCVVYSRLKQIRVREKLVQQKNQQLDDINKKLLENAHIKEEYIGYFFNVISSYILKIEKIKRSTERNLKGKNYEELLKISREIDVKAERANLFYTFDHIFLKLFPNFVDAFNAMLKPEDQIWPKENELLNTNLRIFALMRLGINDTQTIANILETALSTIYTYKNRIKSKALIQGIEFDQQIMDIKFVDIS